MQPDLLGLGKEDLEWYQMLVRTGIVFISAILFLRLAGMRAFGTKTAFDVVVSITLGALLSRCITGHYPFFETLGAALFLSLIHRACAWLTYRSRFFRVLAEGKAVLLFKDGKKLAQPLRRHSITDEDLEKALHEENLDSYKNVKNIWLEPDGKISIVKKES
jgi:uncharacterized membrane protein YcaP (DUF421 family)